MARKHCGKFRNRHGEVVEYPPKGKDMSTQERTKQIEAWMRTWDEDEVGIDNTRCACDPEHPHAPNTEE